jgi:EAL and modified HD-GYP domain-containing signal transduction protein
MLPIVSLLPIVDSQQRIVGITPLFEKQSEELVLQFLSYLQEKDVLAQWPSILCFLPFQHVDQVPINLSDRFGAKQLVLCIAESACAEKESHAKLKHFASQGFRIMMDDFSSRSSLLWPDTKGFVIDCEKGVPGFALPWMFSLQNNQHWAKYVTSNTQLQAVTEAGFSLISGEFAFHPENKATSEDSSSRTRLLKLLGLVARDADVGELEALFKQDSSLSYMLFKLVSAAAFAQTAKISNFGQAINLLGRRQLQRWLQLLLYSCQQGTRTALNPLMLRAAFRASMMEGLAIRRGANRDEQDSAFMVGMFSLLNLLFGADLKEILQPLILVDEVQLALLERKGRLGAELNLVELADVSYSDQLISKLDKAQVDTDAYYALLVQAYAWVNKVSLEV